MRNCCYCNKRASIYDKLIKCSHLNCEYFIHKECRSKRSRTRAENSNWTCKFHLNYVNLCISSESEGSVKMALPRTPPNNQTNNEVSENESIEDPDEIQNEVNSTLNDNVNDELDDIGDTFHEFNQSQIIRSTSYNLNNEKHATNNNNDNTVRHLTPNSMVNEENISIRNHNMNNDNRKSVPLFNNNQRSTRICNICNKEANWHGYVCKGCNKVCHPMCLRDDEEESSDSSTDSYLCYKCKKILLNLTNSLKVTPKVDNLNNFPSTSNHLNTQQSDEYHEITSNSRNDRKSILNKNYSRNIVSNENNSLISNSFGNNSIETYLVKLQYNKLPIVNDSDISWTVFYSAFVRTKALYDPDENVIRLQAAIKDETVKRIGGKGLFNPKTYEKCVEDINRRLKHNINFLTKEATTLEKLGRIKAENKVKLIEFIDRVRNFSTLAEAYKDHSYSHNRRFLANIADVVPIFIKNKWKTRQADLEEQGITPKLTHLIQIFDKELPRLEASIRNDELRGTDKKSVDKVDEKHHRNHNNTNKNSNLRDNNHLMVEKYQSDENESNFSCWYHKTNDHFANKCKALWNLDGKKVTELAKIAKICTFCGNNQHRSCPFREYLKCKTPNCEHNHHSLFCFRRKSPKARSDDVNFKAPECTSSEDDEEKPSTCQNTNTHINTPEEKSFNDMINNLVTNQYYSNIPEDLRQHLTNYQNSHRTSHLIANCSNYLILESKIEKSKIDTGTQTFTINENVKEFKDASTQTSYELIKNLTNESTNNENISYTHNILQNCKQNESDSPHNDIKELAFDKLNLNVKNEDNDKSRNTTIHKDIKVSKCILRSHTNSLKSKRRLKRLTKNVKHKSRKKKSKDWLKKSKHKLICHRKANRSKLNHLNSHDPKRERKKNLKEPSNHTNHELSKINSFIPGTKMKEKTPDYDSH